MKLYIKQKVFTIKDKFTVKNEEGNDKYFVEGKLLSLGKKFYIYNMEKEEVAYIEQKLMNLMPKFFVYVKGEKIAEIHKKFSFLKPKYEIVGKNWVTNGDLWAHEYNITDIDSGNQIASMHKEWMTWGDSYMLDIVDEKHEISIMALILAIDAVMATKN